MMKRRYMIGLFAVFFALAALLAGAYRLSYQRMQRETDGQKEQTLPADGSVQKEEIYYLAERNGYVVVYLSDQKTIYEYTTIEMEHLPKAVQKEIFSGKKLFGMKNLYGFLENYSS